MKILLCNDDGYEAAGIRALYEQLQQFAEVEILAPQQNNSARSSALSVHEPLYLHRESAHIRYLTGTPADCVHIALSTGLLGYRPDWVISGINNGANLGDDTIYSGTVGAAMEGYLFGIRAMAFSQVDKGWAHLDAAAVRAAALVREWGSTPELCLLNINIPNLPIDQLGSVRCTRLGRRQAAKPATLHTDEQGQTAYWVGPAGDVLDGSEGTDFYATARGEISVTPLQIDRTHHGAIADWTARLVRA